MGPLKLLIQFGAAYINPFGAAYTNPFSATYIFGTAYIFGSLFFRREYSIDQEF
jgi:hypothetical protein